MIKSKDDKQEEMAAEARLLKIAIINAIPVGSDYSAILLALADVSKEIIRFWIDQSPPKKVS